MDDSRPGFSETTVSYETLRTADAGTLRQTIRNGIYRDHTAGLGRGLLQANLVILPQPFALDFIRFCQRNPKPCPLVAISDSGDPMMATLGADLDIRTDVPSYNIYRDGELDGQCTDISAYWSADSVAIAIGCSFTFEHALIREGIAISHIEENRTVPIYRSSIQTTPAGPFGGGTVVTMRPIKRWQLEKVEQICRRYPHAHGTPVHVGPPEEIGITDLDAPDWGTPSLVDLDCEPVFWACGVTPQLAVLRARLPLCITHTPGCMIVTDVPEDAETTVLSA